MFTQPTPSTRYTHSTFTRLRTFSARAALLGIVCLVVFSLAAGAHAADTSPQEYFCIIPTQGGTPLAAFFELQKPFFQQKGMDLTLVETPGRGGAYAWGKADSLPTDGSALVGVILPEYVLQAYLDQPFHRLDDVTLTGVLARMPLALWVAKDSPLESVADFVAEVRKTGTPYMAAIDGTFTGGQLAARIFDRAAGVQSIDMPLLSEAECMEAVRTGKALAWWGRALSSDSAPGLKALAVTGTRRSPALPAVPAFRELDMDVVLYSYACMGAPLGVEQGKQQYLNTLFSQMVLDAAWRRGVESLGWEALAVGLSEIPAFFKAESERVRNLGVDFQLLREENLLRP